MTLKAEKRARAGIIEHVQGIKLKRYVYCVTPGPDGTVNHPLAVSADAGWMHWCPACNEVHAIAVEKAFANGAKWSFNGNMDKPSFVPSVKITIGPMPTVPVGRADAGKIYVCHYILTDAVIDYCGDCTHSLRGQKVALPVIPRGQL